MINKSPAWCSEYNFPRPEIHGGRTLPLSQLVARAPLLLIYTPPLIITLGIYTAHIQTVYAILAILLYAYLLAFDGNFFITTKLSLHLLVATSKLRLNSPWQIKA